MRIAFFHELSEGGARRSAREFGKILKKSNTVDLYFVDSKNINDSDGFFSNTFFFKFKEKKWKGKNWKAKLYKDYVELYRLYLLHKKIAKIIISRNYDFVFVEPSRFTQAPFILRFLPKTVYYSQEPLRMIYDPRVNSLNGISGLRFYYEKLNRSIRKKIDSSNIMHASKVLANSEFSKKNIKKAYGIKADVCYMGVDTETFTPRSEKRDTDILYIGAYDSVDGIYSFEEMVKKIKRPLTYKILAREKSWIRSDYELSRLYSSSKITICISRNEPFGLIPLESMACETPVIALNEGGYKETIKNDLTGFLTSDDPGKIAELIDKLLMSKTKLSVLGKQARKDMVSRWQWERGAHEIEEHAKKLF